MPPRRFRRARKPARRFKRKSQRRTVNVNRALQPVAQRYICKMKYSENFNLPGVGGGRYAFNLNSIFDPNLSATGHQPYGHDTLATLYNRYRVISCKWVLNFYNGSTNVMVATMPANEVLTIGLTEMMENPRSRFKSQVPGGSATRITGNQSIASLVGRTKTQYMSDDRYQSLFGASPAELAILNIVGQGTTGALVDINCQILLEYTVEVFDVKHLSQS